MVQPPLGVFASQSGVDATSIWAAATSGHGTIRVHLLACMLARIWESSEATSVWVEIVQERKKDIASLFNSGSAADISTYMIAQQELTREQLANWDASARAWLRVADSVESRRQKQRLILSNVNVSVNSRPTVWESVLKPGILRCKQLTPLFAGCHSKNRLESFSSDCQLGTYFLIFSSSETRLRPSN